MLNGPSSTNGSHETTRLISPTFGSSKYVQPMVVAIVGIIKETQNRNSKP